MKIPYQSEWTPELLVVADKECARVAKNFGLDTYPNQLEIITSQQMMDAYASHGMPNFYNHWSFGKNFVETEEAYKRGQMGLAYEIVINSNPCIAYLMEENSLTMQTLVIAHAAYGHNSFFKGNYLFRQWTDAENIVEYLVYARKFIRNCEDKYGVSKVEDLIDAAHSLRRYGVDRYEHPRQLSKKAREARDKERNDYAQQRVDLLFDSTGLQSEKEIEEKEHPDLLEEPEENLLYFIEKNSPKLEPWQREIIHIIRKVEQYFYPQRQTQIMNEGWATFWHYTILNRLYEEGVVGDGFMLEFLQSHTGVTYQPKFSAINPYALGFNMMCDIRRMCENPTDEDKCWFPDIVNTDWKQTLDFAMRNFKDESFILQYLSPKLIREMRLFSIANDSSQKAIEITAIQNDDGYSHVRRVLSQMNNPSLYEPYIRVTGMESKGSRCLWLKCSSINKRDFDEISLKKVAEHVHTLWGLGISIEVDVDGVSDTLYINSLGN